MQQLCYECHRRLPSSDGVVEGDRHQCVCGKWYQLDRDTIALGAPYTMGQQIICKFAEVLVWALVTDQDVGG